MNTPKHPAPKGAKLPNIAYYISAVRQAQQEARVATQNLHSAIDRLALRLTLNKEENEKLKAEAPPIQSVNGKPTYIDCKG